MKKDFRYIANIKATRSTGTTVFVLFALLFWGAMTYSAVRDQHFRLTQLLSTAALLYTVWTIFQMLFRKRNYLLTWFACMLTLYWVAADWIVAFMLGHYSHEWLKPLFENINPWLLQILWIVLVGCIGYLLYPISKKTYLAGQKKKKSGTFKGDGRIIAGSSGGVGLSALSRNLGLPLAVTIFLDCLFALCLFVLLGWIGWVAFFNASEYYHDEIDHVYDSHEKTELL